jgi:cytochrome c-type biogenesis protein CcmH/NrfG
MNGHRFTHRRASVMTKFRAVFAVAFVAVGLIATTTYGRVEPQPAPAQISPLQMMTGQHLQQSEMTDMSLVFAR